MGNLNICTLATQFKYLTLKARPRKEVKLKEKPTKDFGEFKPFPKQRMIQSYLYHLTHSVTETTTYEDPNFEVHSSIKHL